MLGCIRILYGGALILVMLQRDLKKIVAFISIFHMLSFLFLCWSNFCFSYFRAVLMLFIHRVLSGLFFIVARERFYLFQTRNLNLILSLGKRFFLFFWFFLFFLFLFNLGTPPTLNFFLWNFFYFFYLCL